MSTLGDILEQLQDSSEIHGLIIEAGGMAMIARLEQASPDKDLDPGTLALQAVDAFTRQADDEAWVKLIGRIQNAETPAAACLAEMLQWAMAH